MRITIEAAKTGGFAAFHDPEHPGEPKLMAVGEDLQSLCDRIANPATSSHTVNEWAEMIAACDPSSDQPRVAHMVKLLRAITGCGLKEACTSLKEYL